MSVRDVVDWLIDGASGARTSPEVLGALCDRLRDAGVPVDRAEAFVRTLHPHMVGRRFVYEVGAGVKVLEATYAYLATPEFRASPIARVFESGGFERRRLRAIDESERAYLAPLAEAGLTDFAACPLSFLSGQQHAITYATRREGGFTDDDLAAFRAVTPALSRIAEILALARTATNLLDTYVGRGAGERILAGKIQRGDVETIHAVLWFSDLRGFTTLASEVEPNQLIRALNELFECQVTPIASRGGEVLKFMGDGLLAIFPIRDASPADRAAAALEAADEARAALVQLNAQRALQGDRELRFGLALHLGEIAFGNIGGAGRLDFTAIGPAVNLAARLESLAGKLGEDVVLSEAFRALVTRPVRELGEFELKGVTGKQRAFALGG
jgi:adenylate cyclase